MKKFNYIDLNDGIYENNDELYQQISHAKHCLAMAYIKAGREVCAEELGYSYSEINEMKNEG